MLDHGAQPFPDGHRAAAGLFAALFAALFEVSGCEAGEYRHGFGVHAIDVRENVIESAGEFGAAACVTARPSRDVLREHPTFHGRDVAQQIAE